MTMRTELVGLSGGKKQFWLRAHRREVENYYSVHGAKATMWEFRLSSNKVGKMSVGLRMDCYVTLELEGRGN